MALLIIPLVIAWLICDVSASLGGIPMDPGDRRCKEAITSYLEEFVTVQTKYGNVRGRYVYLCDGPGLPERDRPQATGTGPFHYPIAGMSPGSVPVNTVNPFDAYAGSIPHQPQQTYYNYNARLNYTGVGPGRHISPLSPVSSPFGPQQAQQSLTWRPLRYYRYNVSAFLGIPYAKPPTRENRLRFHPPQPPDVWGAIDANEFRPACPQFKEHINYAKGIHRADEDCLYLNIFSPWVRTPLPRKYPVMMYIHDGDYDHGSGQVFPGHMLAASQEVVVVTFNYRLGVLGFLATSTNASAGNYGMLDQVAAIQWVRENIHAFNGDREMITLFGPGAGGASAGLLALSPISRNFVKRVISQSGAPTADWAVIRDPLYLKNTSYIIGLTYGCRTLNFWHLVECLKSRSFNDFLDQEVTPDVGWLPYGPVPDFATRTRDFQFLPDWPENLLEYGSVRFQPGFAWMTGVTRDEGAARILANKTLQAKGYLVDQHDFMSKVREYVKIYNYTLDQQALINAISFMYSPWADPSNLTQIRDGYRDMLSDSWYVAAQDKLVKLLLKNRVPTYMYVVNYTIQGLGWPEWAGAPHDTEYLLSSGAPFMDPRFYPPGLTLELARWTDSDRNMSQFFMEAWANFAKYGNPTPQALFNTILWKPVELGNLQYLPVNSTNYTTLMQRDYRQKQSQFWNSYIIGLLDKEYVTWPPLFSDVEVELRVYRAATWAILATLIILSFLVILCSCLYCRARADRIGDAALDGLSFADLPASIGAAHGIGTQYSAPSTRANSEISLRSVRSNNISTKPKQEYPLPKHQRYHQRTASSEKILVSSSETPTLLSHRDHRDYHQEHHSLRGRHTTQV